MFWFFLSSSCFAGLGSSLRAPQLLSSKLCLEMNSELMSQDGFTVVKRRGKLKKKEAQRLEAAVSSDHDDGPSESVVLRRISEAEADLESSSYLADVLEVLKKCLLAFPGGAHVRSVVCYGLGNFASCVNARFQFALLICIRRHLSASSAEVYDPVFTEKERKVLTSMGFSVLEENEEGKRSVHKPTLFYMPHCGTPLYNSVLWANWDAASLNQVLILGNSFSSMWTHKLDRALQEKCPFLFNVRPAVQEFGVANTFKYSDVFNDLALHSFNASVLSVDVWSSRVEPEYGEDDEIVLAFKEKCRV
ncbi:SRR1-like protein [Haemaphysalis longicornis]